MNAPNVWEWRSPVRGRLKRRPLPFPLRFWLPFPQGIRVPFFAAAAFVAFACGILPLAAQHRAKQAALPSHSSAHAAARANSRSRSGMTTKKVTAKTRTAPLALSKRPAHQAVHGQSGYGTSGRTSYRASVNPESRLDLIAGLANTLAHGASAIRYPAALANFYAALAANADQPASLPVRVLQFGDSHTAADMLSGEARRVFQGQFGNGGVGFTFPGHPFAGFRILGSSHAESPGWTTLGTHFTQLGDAMLGMGGVAVQTYRPGESITEDAPCTSFEVQYLQQPGGGALQLTDNGVVAGQIDTSTLGAGLGSGLGSGLGAGRGADVPSSPSAAPADSAGSGAGSFRYDCPVGSQGHDDVPHHFVATTLGNAPVRLLGTVALQPGVTWEAMGINGAEAPLMLRWNQALFTAYLARTAASLIVLAYGTNEAAAGYTTESYSEVFARLLDRLHATLPDAAILVMGPADRSTAGRRRGYATFAGTEKIVEAQRDVCRTHGCAFWDWQQRMGGFGSMQRWVLAGWAQPDHTHFTGEGYRTLADALLADLLSGYDAYRVAHGLPSTPLRGTQPGGTSAGSYGQPSSPALSPAAPPNAPALPPTAPTQLPPQ